MVPARKAEDLKHLLDALVAAFVFLVLALLVAFVAEPAGVDPHSPDNRSRNIVMMTEPDDFHPELRKARWER